MKVVDLFNNGEHKTVLGKEKILNIKSNMNKKNCFYFRSLTKFLQIENIKYSPNNFERNWVSTLNNVVHRAKLFSKLSFILIVMGFYPVDQIKKIIIGYYYDINW